MSSAVLYILALLQSFIYFDIFLLVFALRFFAAVHMFECLPRITLVAGDNSVDRITLPSSKPREEKQR